MPGIKRKASSLCDETMMMAPANKRVKLDLSVTVERNLPAAIKRKASSIIDDTPTRMPPAFGSLMSRPMMSSSEKRVKLDSTSINNAEIKPSAKLVQLSEEEFLKRFEETELLGEGSFGKAFRARDNQTKTSVIVKSFPRDKIYNWTNGIPTEIDIMMLLSHKNICPVLEAFESNLNYRMVMPDTNGKDLEKYDAKDPSSVPSFRYIVREVAEGLRYLHEDCLIVHQDIKQENVIVSNIGGEYKVQIIDFGYAKKYSKGVKEFVVDGCTPLCSCKEYYTKTRIIGPEADVFSFGVFLYTMIFGIEKPPFRTLKSLKSNLEVKLPAVIMNGPEDSAIRELLRNTLVKRPSRRWTISQVLSSKYLSSSA